MTEQITLFDDSITLCGIQIKIPHITLRENVHRFPLEYTVFYNDVPCVHIEIHQDVTDTPIYHWVSLDRKQGYTGEASEVYVNWSIIKQIEKTMEAE